ncbi:uncharacterized protein LOC133382899 [Rhineura floridana]|uniref:uncharacterized protein LOC133382899 n=1 Tax=Rhineura floridana TaxID=261503 RepID=UPI002AC8756C|nr:uncharacterized protein LOC133382899 [Rhineura floridana]
MFEEIAKQMSSRGHNRSGAECRNKAKSLQGEYRKVIAHNRKSGNSRATCPFYEKLHNILWGYASITPKRIARSIPSLARTEQPPTPSAMGTPVAGRPQRANINCEGLVTVDVGHYLGKTDVHGAATNQNSSGMQAMPTEDLLSSVDNTIPNPVATLCPAERLAILRTRKTKEGCLESLLQAMLEHSKEEAQVSHRQREQFLHLMRSKQNNNDRMMRLVREELEESRKDREAYERRMSEKEASLSAILNTLNQLADYVCNEQAKTKATPAPDSCQVTNIFSQPGFNTHKYIAIPVENGEPVGNPCFTSSDDEEHMIPSSQSLLSGIAPGTTFNTSGIESECMGAHSPTEPSRHSQMYTTQSQSSPSIAAPRRQPLTSTQSMSRPSWATRKRVPYSP